MSDPSVIYLAEAPAGVWNSGPAVIRHFPGAPPNMLERYRQIGWEVSGPYVLLDAARERVVGALDANWPSGSYSDDDYDQGEDHGRERAWEDAIDEVSEVLRDFETFDAAKRFCDQSHSLNNDEEGTTRP